MPGHETTATGLTWTLHLLSRHPEVAARLRAESDAVLGGRRLRVDDLPRLPFALAVFKEALRLYPPVYMFSRTAATDVTIGGHHIPAGSSVVFSPYALHRREDYFPDPERFDPDRFTPEAEARLPRHAFMPFGSGHRVCVGNHYALLNGQVILATPAQRVRLEATSDREPDLEPMVSLRPRQDVLLTVRRRGAPTAPHAATGHAGRQDR